MIEDIDSKKFDENYGKVSGVPYWVNARCDYEDDFMKKIKNWQFNPPVSGASLGFQPNQGKNTKF